MYSVASKGNRDVCGCLSSSPPLSMHMHSFSAILSVVPQTGTVLGEGGGRGINGPHRLMGWLCDTKIAVTQLRVPSLNAAGVLL